MCAAACPYRAQSFLKGNGEIFAGLDNADIFEARRHVGAWGWLGNGIRRDSKGHCTHDRAQVMALFLVALSLAAIDKLVCLSLGKDDLGLI